MKKIPFVVVIILFCTTTSKAQTSLPRIQKSDITYIGAFAMPNTTAGGSRLGYGGGAICFHRDPASGKKTLFLTGHAWYPGFVTQIEIPEDNKLSQSKNFKDYFETSFLQNFHDITEGQLDSVGDGASIYGMLSYNNRLIVTASMYYDAGGDQKLSHGVSDFQLSKSGDFKGFYAMGGVANPRSKGGYMAIIPQQWRLLFGGPAITGKGGLPIISTNGCGPCLTVFDPDSVGLKEPVPATTLLFYPLSHPLYPPDVIGSVNPFFNLSTTIEGVAFPIGSRSVLFFGTHGIGPYCYGCGCSSGSIEKPSCTDTSCKWCYDPAGSAKGTHAYPYVHQVWGYDANELLLVKTGAKQPWEISPYAIWRMDEIDTSGHASMTGAGYDPESSRLYITESYAEEPHVHVYQVNVPQTRIAGKVSVTNQIRTFSTCEIHSITGRRILTTTGLFEPSSRNYEKLTISLPPGTYLLTFRNSCKPESVKRLIVQ